MGRDDSELILVSRDGKRGEPAAHAAGHVTRDNRAHIADTVGSPEYPRQTERCYADTAPVLVRGRVRQ